ncbi:hypothetical protein HN604_01695 [archaeon]|jgi:hypothetical protein|nr:hypothetical protein [archaeon]MBT6182967.1 hypothetical protein [archaeon]MBT6606568.1 hypothetical protein [archaeon]MBT7251805.1 hypothetical protein [archaeon]MBT7660776.1 hypothetical protein [archaeon]
MKEAGHVLDVLKKVKRLIQEDNSHEIKILSNQTIHQATLSQDPDNIIVAVLVYSIGKILERKHYRNMEGWDIFYNSLLKNLDAGTVCLANDDLSKCRISFGKIRASLNKIDGNLGTYIKDVFRKAEINKAFKIYEHGISSEKTAELLGVSLWDLSSYIGQSSISEAHISMSMPVKKRLKIAEDIFQ